jgi:hypothetical protein
MRADGLGLGDKERSHLGGLTLKGDLKHRKKETGRRAVGDPWSSRECMLLA